MIFIANCSEKVMLFFILWCLKTLLHEFYCLIWTKYLLLPRLLNLRIELTQSLWVQHEVSKSFWISFIFLCLTGMICSLGYGAVTLQATLPQLITKNCTFKWWSVGSVIFAELYSVTVFFCNIFLIAKL